MKKPDSYGSMLILAILILFALMIGTVYKINASKDTSIENMPIPKQHGFVVPPSKRDKKLYIVSSKETAQLYIKNGADADTYGQKIRKFSDFLENIGYKTTLLPLSKLSTLDKNSVVFVLDAQVLTQKNKNEIKQFVKNGGALFFNFLAGYTDEDGAYQAEGFVESMTGLHLSEKGFATFGEGLSVTPKILSPFSEYLKGGKLLSVALYDKLPIYISTEKNRPDILATSFDQVSPPVTKNKERRFKNNEAGVAWHGYLGKGTWIYSSLPSYSFYDITKNKESYKKLLAGMVDFLTQKVVVEPYPYIDQDSAVFVSEDTEYKFTNFKRFADLSQEYKVPVTAFIVANLANLPEHKEMMQEIAKNPYVEFASHSTTHKKIVGESEAFIINETENSKKLIDPFAPRPITGFRPPREELNTMMKKHLAKSGFTYILGAADSYLYPIVDKEDARLLYIARHGTDDYSYLVNLDWDQKEIGKLMQEEAAFVTGLNGIYTLSVHTHLFAYSSNIEIIRAFYEHLKKHPELKPLQGKDIVQRIVLSQNLHYDTKITDNQLIVTITNDNEQEVKNLHLKLYKNPMIKIKSGASSKGSNVTLFEKENAMMLNHIPAKSSVVVYLTLGE
jgi:peptidoglycan/xylan/chitin deacetylase (PgdA/CDA1 family)